MDSKCWEKFIAAKGDILYMTDEVKWILTSFKKQYRSEICYLHDRLLKVW